MPLTDMTRKNQEFHWQKPEEKAFKGIKRKFKEDKILATANPEKLYNLETDASNRALRAHLSQKGDDGCMRPVAFYTRKFSPAEQNYDIYDQELLAIIDTLKHWRHHLQGAKYPVTVITDHQNLTTFTTTKKLNKRQVRWSEEIANYDIRIRHRRGSENQVADALS